MFKELLNKMKLFKKFCVAVATGNMYTPYVRAEMKRYEEEQKRQQLKEEEKRVYAKGGVVEPILQRFELDEGEVILPEEALKRCVETINAIGASMEEAADGMVKIMNYMKMQTERQNTNNWRKMHGLPMRRKAGRKK